MSFVNDSIDTFGKTARGLSRNPLGIIALFIVLVYAIAALTLGISGTGLEPAQKTPIVWFLVLFPPIVLVVFAWLVSHHHTKLYAPGDFRDDRAFLQALSPDEQRERLEKEVNVVLADEPVPDATANTEPPPRPSIERDRLVQTVNIAEDLALREISAEFGASVRRQLKVQQGNEQLWLDGAFEQNGLLTGVEVVYLRHSSYMHRLRSLSDLLLRAKVANLRMIIAVVVDGLETDAVERRLSELRPRLEAGGVSFEFRLFRLDELKKKYGLVG